MESSKSLVQRSLDGERPQFILLKMQELAKGLTSQIIYQLEK